MVIIDLFSWRVVGGATSDRLKMDLALQALKRAVRRRQPTAGLIHYADRLCRASSRANSRDRAKHSRK
ncbi:hypothetical protein [Actibacterium sp.]|uniref:hypothetical protein n=1 Tax=Actibacterium sp. TaxID=1872125 RepID=UPI00338DC73E